MFSGYDDESETFKRSTKGIPHGVKYQMEQFIQVLFNENISQDRIEINSLRLNRDKQMSRMKIYKVGLSDIFIKMQVADDKISCSPLKKDNKYI